jgi:hypothetical protein
VDIWVKCWSGSSCSRLSESEVIVARVPDGRLADALDTHLIVTSGRP